MRNTLHKKLGWYRGYGFEAAIEKKGLRKADFGRNFAFSAKTYVSFHKSERSQILIEIWDQRFKTLLQSGELDTIYKKYPDVYPDGYIR